MTWSFLGSQTLASSGTSTYAPTLPEGTQMMEVQPAGGPAYVTFDGTAPSSVAGMVLSTGNGFYRFTHNALEATKVVFDSTACQLYLHYFG